MTRPDLTVAFHVGVHKTATTHLQKTIKRVTEPLAAEGVRFYGPGHFRGPGRTIQSLFGLHPKSADAAARRSPQEQLTLMAKGADRIVISEENFIGGLNNPKLNGPLRRYKPAGQRLAMFAAAIERPVDIFIGLRLPTGYLNSAYCQMLVGGRARPPAMYLRQNPLASVNWVDLITRIRAAEGVGSVTVWRFEDYAALFPAITEAMLGEGPAKLVPRVARPINSGLSAAAVAEILHRATPDNVREVTLRTRQLLPVEAGYPRFDAFTEEEHAMSRENYAAQIAAIAAMPGVRLLTPETAPASP